MTTDLPLLRARCAEPMPHPGPDETRRLADAVVDLVVRNLLALPERPPCRSASRAELEALLRQPLPESGRDLSLILADFERKIAPFACRPDHPRFLAFIPAAPTIYSILGDWLGSGHTTFAGVWLEAAGPAMVELVELDWFRDILGMPEGTAGLLTSGGSEANLLALVVARERLAPADRGRAVLYVGAHRHWSVDRAGRIIGLLPEQIHVVEGNRLEPTALAERVSRDREAGLVPWAVVAAAGTTNTGMVDPLDSLADYCSRESLFLHVDAAYGWAAALVPEGKQTLAGLARADSVTLDPHKWLAQTYEVGGLLVRDGASLTRTFALRPEYMEDVSPADGEVNFCDRGLALTRRFRALQVWVSIQALGIDWFRNLVRHGLALAHYAEALLGRSGFEVVAPARLSIVCFRHVPEGTRMLPDEIDAHNRRLVDAVRATGEVFLSSTRLEGRVALRFCFVNWRTTADDVDRAVALLARLAGAT